MIVLKIIYQATFEARDPRFRLRVHINRME